MEKYFVFRKMMDFMADYAEVVDADMDHYDGTMMVKGVCDDQIIEIRVSITKKEDDQNA